MIIDGVQRTGAEGAIAAPGRSAYRHVEICGFTAEARIFVADYLPARPQRVAELTSRRLNRLLERPAHSQMLCEIGVREARSGAATAEAGRRFE